MFDINTPPITDNECQLVSSCFLKSFKKDGYISLPPSSLIHESVPMSFVMSAGLVQVENNLAEITEKTGGKFAFTQPCFRYFDMKQVGSNSNHLSLFHMSAAFHIGSTERKPILSRLWMFLTETLKLDEKCLWVTYLDDCEIGKDKKTYDCWRQLGVSKRRLVGLDQQSNFWRQRETGKIASDGKKCGPHTEIFYERESVLCTICENNHKKIGSCNCGRFVEISNSLFIENYLSDSEGLIKAETVFSESVVGIERVLMILNNKRDVYHLSRFTSWRRQLSYSLPPLPKEESIHSINIIVDHLFAFNLLIEHNAPLPGRGGQARIMRTLARAIMQHLLLLGFESSQIFNKNIPFIYLLSDVLKIEFLKFSKTLEKGERRLQKMMDNNQTITQNIKKSFHEKHGIPPALFDKVYDSLNILDVE